MLIFSYCSEYISYPLLNANCDLTGKKNSSIVILLVSSNTYMSGYPKFKSLIKVDITTTKTLLR